MNVDVVVPKGNYLAVKNLGITLNRVLIIDLNPLEDSKYVYSTIRV